MAEHEIDVTRLTTRPILSAEDFKGSWGAVDVLSLPGNAGDRYLIGFAHSDRSVERALRLRYEVFNLELDEGLASSAATGLDRDDFDAQMTHLLLIEQATGAVVGTYRMQTVAHGLAHGGLYSAQEFDMSGLEPYFDEAIELGRACLAADHRSMRAVIALWQGIGAYMNLYGLYYMFGCCSLTTRDMLDGWRAMKTIRKKGHLHDSVYLSVLPEFSCGDEVEVDAIPLPKLFRTYMRLGTKVVSAPAIDRAFGTVDFLVMLDARVVTFSQLDIVK
ncbi:MAG TPA: GNAT family N-acetyltransferase [Candidatus Hydrogenedentes bacterium]|nr:GNAT family N-acetyltransferase [Candidatus Hydrogenedentota bacterium]